MATIMSFSNSDGTRRCDSRCHGARQPECKCICGGKYHGCSKGSKGPDNLIDAELMRQGVDPDAVDIETKRRISQEVVKTLGAKDGLEFMIEFGKRVGLPVQGKPRDLQGHQLPLL